MQYFSNAKQIKSSLGSSTSQKLPTIAWKSTCSRPGLSSSIEVLDSASTNNNSNLAFDSTNTMLVSKPVKMNSSRNHNSPSKTAKANYSSVPTKTYKMIVSKATSKLGQTTLIAPANSGISSASRCSMTKSAEQRRNNQ